VRPPTLDQLPSPPPGKTGWPWTEHSPPFPDRAHVGSPLPRVSVVTPSYNQGELIEETIRSVLLQGYPDLEYIIIDGASTDGTVDVIRRYQPWLTYWTSQPDRGQTDAINRGWRRATGEILAYINTDDCYLPAAIATVALEFSRRPELAMVYGTAMIVDQTGKELREWQAEPFDLKRMLLLGSIVPQPATFFAKAVVTSLGYLNETRDMIMDYELCTRIGAQFPTACIPRTLAKFRAHPQSKTVLRFETTAHELIDFVTNFSTTRVSAKDMQAIRKGALGRIHYEWAVEYLLRGHEGSKILKQLLRSIRLHPRFALRRPRLTAHLARRVVADYVKSGATRVASAGRNPKS
jgi:glycosyltransferase involved in cell wall biosynthesis